MPIYEHVDVEECVKRIKDSIDKNPANRFVFFIGAGCSIQSKISGAETLTKNWLNDLKYFWGDDKYSDWYGDKIGKEGEKNLAKFYFTVIKERFHTKAQRQQAIEKIVDQGRASWGYVALANLLTSKDYGKNFNVVLTTNFDNLIAESIYRHTSEKVRVIGHDSLMSYVNTHSIKPQIVKLHGDAEFEPKNTTEETRELNIEVLEIMKQTLQNCGLIFVGYGGNDESIINSLEKLNSKSISNGIFWIRNSLPNSKLKDWLEKHDNTFWIKHSDFDELMVYFSQYFDIPRPSKKKCLEIENDFQISLEKLSKQIENNKSENDKIRLRKILQKYVASVDDWVKLVTEANGAATNDFNKALVLYEEGLKKFNSNPIFLVHFGNLYYNHGMPKEAIQYYDKSLEIDPNDAITISNKGRALALLGKYQEALQCYDKSLKIDPSDDANLSCKGSTLQELGRNEEAMQFYDRALEINPNDVTTLHNKGTLLQIMGKPEEALKYYDKSLEVDPNQSMVLTSKGTILQDLGKYQESIPYFDKALEIDPKNAIALNNKGFSLNYLDKYQEALQYYDMALTIDPKNEAVIRNKKITKKKLDDVKNKPDDNKK